MGLGSRANRGIVEDTGAGAMAPAHRMTAASVDKRTQELVRMRAILRHRHGDRAATAAASVVRPDLEEVVGSDLLDEIVLAGLACGRESEERRVVVPRKRPDDQPCVADV